MNDKYCGMGEYTRPNGFRYVGQWKDSKRDGLGVCSYAKGHEFNGGWQLGKRCGRGVMKYNNGDRYVGVWVNDIYHGAGNAPNGVGHNQQL